MQKHMQTKIFGDALLWPKDSSNPGGAAFFHQQYLWTVYIGDGFATGYEATCNSVENLTHLGLHRRVV